MRRVKSISFNIVDPFEKQLLDHSKQYSNFSVYVKRLIQRDMEGGSVAHKTKMLTELDNEVDLDSELMSNML